MSKKNDLKAELEEKGIEFNPKAKIAELEELNAEPVESESEDVAPSEIVEPEISEKAPEPVKSKFIEGKFVENAPVMSANLVNGIMEVQTPVAHYRLSEAEYNAL